MSFLKTATRNVLSNWAGFATNALIALVMTPYFTETLGDAKYGLWCLLIAFTGYYGLLDLGVRSAVAQYVTRYWAKNDIDRVSTTLSTAFAYLLCVSLILIPLALGIAFAAPHIFNLDQVPEKTSILLFIIVGVGFAINLPLMVFQTSTYARQRFDIANAIGISKSLIAAGLWVLVIESGWGLLGVAAVHFIVEILSNLVRVWITFRLLPGVKIRRSKISKESRRELVGYGSHNVFINAADLMQIHVSAIVISVMLSTKALAHYSIGAILITQMAGFVNSISWALTPQATTVDAHGKQESLRGLWIGGSRAATTVAALFAGGFMMMGSDFLKLWVQPEYTNGATYISSAVILAILAIATLLRSSMSVAKQICFGLREMRFLAKLALAESVLNIALTALLVWHYGILGAAIANLLAIVLTQMWCMPIFVARRIKVPVSVFLRSVPWPGILVIATLTGTSLLLKDVLPVNSWGSFSIKVALIALAATAVGLVFGTNREEKDRMLRFFGTQKSA
jgi:O-antigen/teichoic acid export membrane protein